ncbi:MAG: hypothetical protein QXO51_07195 [Halobacteria archaeon]
MSEVDAHWIADRAEGALSGAHLWLLLARDAGRRPDPEATVTSLEEARNAADRIADLSRRIREVPGLDEGHLGRLHASLRGLVREYGKRPWWHHRFLVRELDAIALEVRGLARKGSLSPEHLGLLDAALTGLKHRRFRTADKLLRRFDEALALVAERERAQAAYRPYRRRLEEETRGAEERVLALQGVPAPEASSSDVEAAEREAALFNASSARAVREFLARAPGREVLRVWLDGIAEGVLPLPPPPDPEAARELLRLLEGQGGELGRMDLHGLVEVAGYSEARFAHLGAGSHRLRGALASCASWLRSLVQSESGVGLSLREPPASLLRRMDSLLRILAKVPGGEEALRHLRALQALAQAGRLEAIQRSAVIYAEHGEAARKRWNGMLEAEIAEKRRALEGLRRSLESLPPL